MAGSIVVLATSAATQDVVSTTTETSIFAPNIPANTLATANFVQVLLLCDLLKNVSFNFTVRIKFGGTTYYQDATSLGSSATRRTVFFRITLAGRNATNAQTLGAYVGIGTAGGATTGLGDFATDEIEATTPLFNGALAIDQTADRTLDVTIQPASSSASLSWRRHYGIAIAFKA